jgi:hypothetical protein
MCPTEQLWADASTSMLPVRPVVTISLGHDPLPITTAELSLQPWDWRAHSRLQGITGEAD